MAALMMLKKQRHNQRPKKEKSAAQSDQDPHVAPSIFIQFLKRPANAKARFLCAALFLCVFCTFFPAVHNGFVGFDDRDYVVQNAHVATGLKWANIVWAFREYAANNWHPLTWLSHMLDCQMFGLNAWGHHLTSILIHAANVVLVFLVFRKLTGATWRSFFVAALFGLHPLRVESVAWIAERKDVLSTFFGMLTIWAYAGYAKETQTENGKSKSFYAFAFLFFVLSLLSKPMLVTWPCLLLLLDYWPLRRFEIANLKSQRTILLRLLREKIPFFMGAGVISYVTFVVQKNSGALEDSLSLPVRAENAVMSCSRYLGKMLYPLDLSCFYPYRNDWPASAVTSSLTLLLGITILAIALRRTRPYLFVGWFWFLGTLVPVIGLIQVGQQSMADRYTYIPLIGIFVILVWGVQEVTKRWRHQVLILAMSGTVIISVCMAITSRQIGYWKDSITLFRHALAVTKNNYLAEQNLGSVLAESGQLDEAIAHYRAALKIKPDYALARRNLIAVFNNQGQLDQVIFELRQFIKEEPENASGYYSLGFAFGKKGMMDEAIPYYEEALRLQPNYPQAEANLGLALMQKERWGEALGHLEAAARQEPDNSDVHYYFGQALSQARHFDDAIFQFKRALQLQPDRTEAYFQLALTFSKKNQWDEAISNYREVLKRDPLYPHVHDNLASALAHGGQWAEALRESQVAVEVAPDNSDSRYNLGLALAKMNRLDEAIQQFQKALSLNPDNARVHNELGVSLIKKGQIEKAITQFQEASKLEPGSAEAQQNLKAAFHLKDLQNTK